MIDLAELWQFHELILFLAWRDVKVRYKQTALGAAWAILQPLLMMVIFSVFFGKMAGIPSGEVPYPLFVLTGLLPWTFFATAVNSAANSVVGSERLITKIYFPRMAIPLASVGAAIVDFFVACVLIGFMMLGYGIPPKASVAICPFIVLLILMLALGVGTLLAALNVRFRDFKYVIPFCLQLGLFATPTIYMSLSRRMQSRYAWMIDLNPMASLVAGFRASILEDSVPWGSLGIASVMSLTMFAVGCIYFRRVEDSFADII